ncbi:tyrosine-type recombinase/integrase [Thalassoglobus sp. JC818]|uniref:tyrosine-type recombinase/integrase n=1 Tax=Thalassoglobus sp. JC818 TaxID=3232136 RepID=UPI00345ABCD1
MGKRVHLTNATVSKLPLPDERAEFIHDSKLTGFAVSVSKTGRKVFYYYGRVNGQPKRLKIGTFPDINATDARACCRSIVGDIAKGKDVSGNRRAGRRTLGELFDLYLTVHAKPNKRTWESDVRDFNRFCKHWKNKPLIEIRRGLISDLIADIQGRKGASPAHKVRALLSKMFNIALKHEWCEYNPVTGTDRPKIASRDRYLRPEEMKAFFDAVDGLQRETTRDFIKLAVFTGARRSNLCTMCWEELDLNRGVWTIPREKFKGKRVHVVPLIPQALEILRRRQQEATAGVPWVFPGGGKTGHIIDPKEAMKRVKEQAGIENLRFHDLRRTLGAWQNNAGTPTRIIQNTLGHADIGTTAKAYTPTEIDPVRNSMQAAVEMMLNSGEGGAE